MVLPVLNKVVNMKHFFHNHRQCLIGTSSRRHQSTDYLRMILTSSALSVIELAPCYESYHVMLFQEEPENGKNIRTGKRNE